MDSASDVSVGKVAQEQSSSTKSRKLSASSRGNAAASYVAEELCSDGGAPSAIVARLETDDVPMSLLPELGVTPEAEPNVQV